MMLERQMRASETADSILNHTLKNGAGGTWVVATGTRDFAISSNNWFCYVLSVLAHKNELPCRVRPRAEICKIRIPFTLCVPLLSNSTNNIPIFLKKKTPHPESEFRAPVSLKPST